MVFQIERIKERKKKTNIDDVKYAMGFMNKLFGKVGFRITGTQGEHDGAKLFEEELKQHCDEVHTEDFSMSPGAYPGGMIKPIGYMYLLSILAYILFPLLSWIALIPLFLWILELFGLKRAIDPFYPKKKSMNVYGKIIPKKEKKTIIVFAGHHDSPYCFPITAGLRKMAFPIIILTLIFALFFITGGIIRSVMALQANNIFLPIFEGWIWVDWFFIVGILDIPAVMWITQSFVSKQKSFGANDNLSGAVTALTLARYFKEHRPDYTELWFVAFGAEENGQRGSTEFALRHKAELLKKDGYLINYECVGGADYLVLVTSENMKIPPCKHSEHVYNLLKAASMRCELNRQCLRTSLKMGYTDAEGFSRSGLKASTVIGLMADGFPIRWHVPDDVPENIEWDCIRDSLEIGISAVELRDKEVSNN